MTITAYDFNAPLRGANGVSNGIHFGISGEHSAAALRELAGKIDRKEVLVEGAKLYTFAEMEDFSKSILKLTFIEKH